MCCESRTVAVSIHVQVPGNVHALAGSGFDETLILCEVLHRLAIVALEGRDHTMDSSTKLFNIQGAPNIKNETLAMQWDCRRGSCMSCEERIGRCCSKNRQVDFMGTASKA